MSPLKGSSIVHPKLHEKITGWRSRGLPDACTITRASDQLPSLDTATGISTPAPPTIVYDGPCTVQPAPSSEHMQPHADGQLTLRKYVVSIDACREADDDLEIDVDDVVTVSRTKDVRMAGRELVVIDVQYDTFQSRRLLICEDRPGVPDGH